jgi:membrane protein DedA with SNARE-associated domain
MRVTTISALAWAGTWTGAGYALYHVTIAIGPVSARVAGFMLVTGVIAAAVFALKRWRRAPSFARAH